MNVAISKMAGAILAKGLLLYIWCNFDVIFLLQLSYLVIKTHFMT